MLPMLEESGRTTAIGAWLFAGSLEESGTTPSCKSKHEATTRHCNGIAIQSAFLARLSIRMQLVHVISFHGMRVRVGWFRGADLYKLDAVVAEFERAGLPTHGRALEEGRAP